MIAPRDGHAPFKSKIDCMECVESGHYILPNDLYRIVIAIP
jgi:hypothetical protein